MEKDKEFDPEIQEIYSRIIDYDNPLDSIQAAFDLGEHEDKDQALDALLQAICTVDDSDVKLTILDILSGPDFFDERIVESISNLLEDSDSEVREQAADLLGMTKSKNATGALVRALPNAEKPFRYNIMAALANIGDVEASPSLWKLLDSGDWEDRYHAIDAIGMLAHPDSLPYLLKSLDDKSAKVQEHTILSIGHYKNKAVIDKLLCLLDCDAIEVQGAAIYKLGEFQVQEAIPQILDLLKTDDEDLEIVVLEALAKLKSPKAIPFLIEKINSENFEIRIAAQEALDMYENQDLVEPMIEAIFQDPKIKYMESRVARFSNESIPLDDIKKFEIPEWAQDLIVDLFLKKLGKR